MSDHMVNRTDGGFLVRREYGRRKYLRFHRAQRIRNNRRESSILQGIFMLGCLCVHAFIALYLPRSFREQWRNME